jgi:hypothetical protein
MRAKEENCALYNNVKKLSLEHVPTPQDSQILHLPSLAFLTHFRKQKTTLKKFTKKSQVNNKIYLALTAERGGFEPPVPVSQYACLANMWFQPLTHPSKVQLRWQI